MNNSYLLSIIIPTHNRYKYLIDSIRCIVDNTTHLSEIIISDSSSIKMPTELKKIIDQSEIKYIKTKTGISVVENFNIGLQNASGEYVTFIGDDDIVLSNIEDVVRKMKKLSIENLTTNNSMTYQWPDFKSKYLGKSYSSKLIFNRVTKRLVKINEKKELNNALNRFGLGPLGMPRMYYGITERNKILEINSKAGLLFGGVSPDVYSSALLSLFLENCYILDDYVFLPGASGQSTSGKSADQKHHGQLRDNDHISPFRNLEWDRRIPEFYSVPSVWSFSLLCAVQKSNYDQNRINWEHLYAVFLLRHMKQYKIVFHAIKNNQSFSRVKFVQALINEILRYISRILNRIKKGKLIPTDYEISNLASIKEANEFIINEKKINLEVRF